MGGGSLAGTSLLPLATATTIVVGLIVIALVVAWLGPAVSKAGTLGVFQWVRAGSSKLLGEMDLIWVPKEETSVQLSETEIEKGNGMQGGSFLCQIKTRVETLAPMELEEGILGKKTEVDGVSLVARQERL